MKKILALFICFQIAIAPVFASYDFSDEAQEEFDRNKYNQFQPVDFTKKKERREIKRNNYIPETQEEYIEVQDFVQVPSNELLYPPQQEKLYGSIVKVPIGTTFDIVFDAGISSGSLDRGDRLTVRLVDDFSYNGVLVAPAGSLIYGSATNATSATYAYGSGAIELNFDEILTPDGNLIKISTEKIYMEAKSERAKKMTRDVLIGAVGSLLVGAAFTALGGGDDWGRNMAIYGGIGALGGGLRGAAQRGEDVFIDDGTVLQLRLTQPLNVNPY